MKIMTKKLEGDDASIPKKSNYSILAPLDLTINPERVSLLDRIKRVNATKSNLVIRDQKNKCLKEILSERLFYVSHPSLSNLECSINLNLSQRIIPSIDKNIFFEETVKEILELGNFNHKQIDKRDKSQTILFKDVAAMKLLNIIFKDNENHALYPIYLKWIDGSEWLKY
jgi:hypothetical protein